MKRTKELRLSEWGPECYKNKPTVISLTIHKLPMKLSREQRLLKRFPLILPYLFFFEFKSNFSIENVVVFRSVQIQIS